MKIALTGANGFIGSHLAEFLKAQGHEVHCIVRKTSNLQWMKDKGYVFHTCGLTDIDALAVALADCDYVFHLAGTVAALTYEDYLYGNVILTKNVFEAALKSPQKPKKIIVTSSLAVGGPSTKNNPIDETVGFNAVSLYGKAKVEQEKLCQAYKDKLPIAIARPSVISGEREVELFEYIKAVDGGLVPLVGFSDKYLGVINIKDLVQALYDMALSEKTAGEAYFLSSEETISWKALAEMIAQKLGKKPFYLKLPHFVIRIAGSASGFVGKLRGKAPTFDAEKSKEGVQEAWTCKVDKAKRDFGFQQTVSIEQGIEESIVWYKDKGWL